MRRDLRAVLFDIEGTTTPISFVYDTLFPYAREAFEGFLQSHWDRPEVRQAGALLCPETSDLGPEVVLKAALEAMDRDLKLGPLKALQGWIWEDGYASGRLRGQLFEEVADCLKTWKSLGLTLAIYSSGSVLAQQLLFGHSSAGDLRPWIDAYFDTGVGPKVETESYRRIAETLGLEPWQGLFLSDVVAELKAARAAGWQAILLRRPGNPEPPAHDFKTWTSFPQELPVLE